MRMYILICFLFFKGMIAQDNTITTQQFWLDYNQKWLLSERLSVKAPIGMKTISTGAWNRYFISPEVVYRIPKLMLKSLYYKEEISGGLDLYYNQNINGTDVIEVTPYQSYGLTWPNRERLDLKHQVVLRERFQFNTDNWDSKFGLKLSYELSLTLKFQGDLWKYGKGFYLPVSMKFYWNLIDAAVFNNVFRITPGLGYQINKKWKAAFLIGYNRTRNGIDEQFKTNDVIYRVRLYHTIDKKKKQVKTN